jgi:hypothetical protein
MENEMPKNTDIMDMLGGAEAEEGNDTAKDTGEDTPEVSTPDSPFPVPTSKAIIHKMKVVEMDSLYTEQGVEIEGWSKLKSDEKKEALIGHFFPSDNAIAEDEVIGEEDGAEEVEDVLTRLAKKIELMKDQEEIEDTIIDLIENEGLSDFRLGGLFSRLQEIGDFEEHGTFKDYVAAKFGVKYRKALYLIEIYQKLVETGVKWDQVSHIGWTKLKTILPIINEDNFGDWTEKAQVMNTISLEEAVKLALQEGGATDSSSALASTLKTKTFKLAPDAHENVTAAIDKAKKSTNSEADGFALEMICLDFLAGDANTAAAKVAKLQAKVKELTEKLEASENKEGQHVDLDVSSEGFRTMFKLALKTHGESGSAVKKEASAVQHVFKHFEEVFPHLDLKITKATKAS